MVVIRNINNNVSLCADSRGQEAIVSGKGVGFVKPPQEIPLSKMPFFISSTRLSNEEFQGPPLPSAFW